MPQILSIFFSTEDEIFKTAKESFENMKKSGRGKARPPENE